MAKPSKQESTLKPDEDGKTAASYKLRFSESLPPFGGFPAIPPKPSYDALFVAAKVEGTLTYLSPEEEAILDTLKGLNIVLNVDGGWIRGYKWRENVRKYKK